MSCKTNEVAILKAVSVELDSSTVMLLTYMYHTPSKEAKQAGEKSFYRYEGRVVTKEDLQKEIDFLKSDSQLTMNWKWPTKSKDWNPEWFLMYDYDNSSAKAAKWYASRLKKAVKWEDFLKYAKEGTKMTAKGPKSYPSARYDLEGYVTEDGMQFDITSPEEMLKHVGKCFTKKVILKRELPK